MAPGPKGILRPGDRLPLVSRALAFGAAAPLTEDGGIFVTARMSGGLSKGDLATIKGDRTLTAMLNRWAQNEGRHLVAEAQRLTRRLDTIDTHLFLSSWSYMVGSDAGSDGLKTRIWLTNAAPYAMYVHPKRDRRLFVDFHMKRSGWLAAQTAEARRTLATLKPRIAQKIANDAARELRRGLTAQRRAGGAA